MGSSRGREHIASLRKCYGLSFVDRLRSHIPRFDVRGAILEEVIEPLPVLAVAFISEVHVQNATFFLFQSFALQDGLVAFFYDVHVIGVAGEGAVVENRLARLAKFLPLALGPRDRSMAVLIDLLVRKLSLLAWRNLDKRPQVWGCACSLRGKRHASISVMSGSC